MNGNGITYEGFSLKRFPEIREEIANALRQSSAYGTEVNLLPDSPLGQLIDIISEREARLWELAQAVYDAAYPDSAWGSSLDNVCALIGVRRRGPTPSQAEVTFISSSDLPITIPYDIQVSTKDSGVVFVLSANEMDVGSIVLEPHSSITLEMGSVQEGPVQAPAGTLINMMPSIPNVSVTNYHDAEPGSYGESDTDLRWRRLEALQASGTGTTDAIRARLMQEVEDIIDAVVIENPLNETDDDGRPPHTFEVIAVGGDRQDILEKIWEIKPAGIRSVSTLPDGDEKRISGEVLDSMGFEQELIYSEATMVHIWMHIQLYANLEFDFGQPQFTSVTVSQPLSDTNYSLIVNGIEFVYTSSSEPPQKIDILNGLMQTITTAQLDPSKYLPLNFIVDTAPSEPQLRLEAKYNGYYFMVHAPNMVDNQPLLGVFISQMPNGDQLRVIQEVVMLASQIQSIGKDVYRYKYFSAVNVVENIENVIIKTSHSGGNPDSMEEENIATAGNEIADFDSTRVTVEVLEIE